MRSAGSGPPGADSANRRDTANASTTRGGRGGFARGRGQLGCILVPMRFMALVVSVVVSLLSFAGAAGLKYALPDRERLTLTLGGRTTTLIDTDRMLPAEFFGEGVPGELGAGAYMYDLVTRDFDADGVLDALVGFSYGGNCCPMEYRFLTVGRAGRPRLSNAFYSWNTPRVERLRGQLVLRVRDQRETVATRWALRRDRAVKVDEQHIPELRALRELRVDAVGAAPRSFRFDANADGVAETVTCERWERWETLVCGVTSGQRVLLEPGDGCDRFGFLPGRTRGYHDVVCNVDRVGRWNGRQYLLEAPP